jgi:tRNA-2-methylthio-N6-dimethylallyladenosine synthase
MNEYDSDLIRSILVESGHTLAPDEHHADVILLNTCAVRENAHTKIYSRLQHIRAIKAKKNFPVTIGILGCMAQSLRQDLLESNHELDFIAGPDSYRELPGLIARSRETSEKGLALELSQTETYSGVDPLRAEGVNAWVAVMRGCDNMCSFCVVPFTRGRERSRDPKGVIAEVQALARDGFKQVTLLGQNVNSYKHGSTGFADLARSVADVPGIERVRFTSPHPKDFPKPLLDVIADHPRVCRHIHLPLQAGNNRILELMKRTYTIEEFRDLVDTIRGRIPGVAISTDIIVGFAGETAAEYEDTYRALEEIRFDFAFIFKYSERKGTYAARKLTDDVPEETKTERIMRLVELQKQITGEINQTLVGDTVEILAENEAKKHPGSLSGRTDTFKTTIFRGGGIRVGDIVNVTIESSRGAGLYGRAAGRSTRGEENVCAG